MATAYTLRIPQPEARRICVAVSSETRGAPALDVRLPVWTPGSYLIREHERHVDGLSARDGDGRPLAVEKTDKQTWRISCGGARRVQLEYRLAAFELTVRTNHVDATHAFVNPAATCVFIVGREGEACTVRTELPPGWQTWVALPLQDDGAVLAQDYDELADSPFEMGPLSSHSAHAFAVRGVPHELVVWGRGDFDATMVVPDIAKIVEAEAAIFGGLPYAGERYLCIVHLNEKGRGGLEHRRSCALLAPRFGFGQKSGYEDFLLLVAHEVFHSWNVKRLRPQAFTPYDWTRENPTRLLWAVEGLTSAYEVIALRRAGLITPQRFLEIWAERVTQLLRTPGRLRTSLAQASFDAWIKHYRPDESTPNTTVSYYLKGSVVGMFLDLELRRRSRGEKSLDDLLRALFARYGRPPGLPEEGVERTATDLLGAQATGLERWFDRGIRTTEELDYEGAFASVGLSPLLRPQQGPDDKGGAATQAPKSAPETAPRAFLGAALREKGATLEVGQVLDGSPVMSAGLCAGDEIVAVEGFRSEMKQRLARAAPGRAVRLSVFRSDELLEVRPVLAELPRDTVVLVPDPRASPEAKRLRAAWLGAEWPEEAGQPPIAQARPPE